MSEPIELRADDRVLVVAPHPDDESLAAGGLLQHAAAAGAAVRVLYFTDGENNPWAQRAVERRWRIGPADRERFGALRRGEARSALEVLGIPGASAKFLGVPDQGATSALLDRGERACIALAGVLDEFRPTLLAAPSRLDLHPDHSAVAVLLRLALSREGAPPGPREDLAYLVHHPGRRIPTDGPGVSLTPEQVRRKRQAILRHRTQLIWRQGWMLSFAAAMEPFLLPGPTRGILHPVRSFHREGDTVVVALESHVHARASGRRILLLRGVDRAGEPLCLAVPVPGWSGRTALTDPRTGAAVARAAYLGTPWRGRLALPAAALRDPRILFVKLVRRFGFFDEAGWADALGDCAAARD